MFESIAAFFALGAIGFYLFVALLSIIFTVAVENDKSSGYFFSGILTLIGILIYHTQLFALVLNWQLFLGGFLAYGLVGGVWSVYRWFRYCRSVVQEHPYDDRTPFNKGTSPEDYYSALLKPRDHKSQLTSWIIFWPWSLLWNLTGDFFTNIYESLANIYEKVAASAVRAAVNKVTPKPTINRQTTEKFDRE